MENLIVLLLAYALRSLVGGRRLSLLVWAVKVPLAVAGVVICPHNTKASVEDQ